ncbi:MAG: helix-turn-helix domain-containing protein [Rhodoferax sp.]
MNTIKAIRGRLGLTQAELAAGMGCTQGNVGHYERGQTVPPDAAKRLIEYAGSLGLVLTYNDVYMPELAAAPDTIAQAATETVVPEPIQTTDTSALRSGAVRRHSNRRAEEDAAERERRAKGGPPFQSLETGEA